MMNTQGATVIWRDAYDRYMVHFGIRHGDGYKEPYSYCVWFSIFIDAVEEIFGKDAADRIYDLQPGFADQDKVPIEVELTLSFREPTTKVQPVLELEQGDTDGPFTYFRMRPFREMPGND